MIKILQARLQQYVNRELPDVQAGFRKSRGTRDQIANICWIMEKARVPENICFCFIDFAKAFDYVEHHKLWNILKEMGIPDYLSCLLRNLYAGQVVWYSHLFQNFPQFIVIHTVKGFGIVNKAEIDVFLVLSCLEFTGNLKFGVFSVF